MESSKRRRARGPLLERCRAGDAGVALTGRSDRPAARFYRGAEAV